MQWPEHSPFSIQKILIHTFHCLSGLLIPAFFLKNYPRALSVVWTDNICCRTFLCCDWWYTSFASSHEFFFPLFIIPYCSLYTATVPLNLGLNTPTAIFVAPIPLPNWIQCHPLFISNSNPRKNPQGSPSMALVFRSLSSKERLSAKVDWAMGVTLSCRSTMRTLERVCYFVPMCFICSWLTASLLRFNRIRRWHHYNPSIDFRDRPPIACSAPW